MRRIRARDAFKALALILTVLLIVPIIAYAPSVINSGFDLNLDLIKRVSALLPAWYGALMEASLRFMNAEKVFLFGEITMFIKLIMLGIGRAFRQ